MHPSIQEYKYPSPQQSKHPSNHASIQPKNKQASIQASKHQRNQIYVQVSKYYPSIKAVYWCQYCAITQLNKLGLANHPTCSLVAELRGRSSTWPSRRHTRAPLAAAIRLMSGHGAQPRSNEEGEKPLKHRREPTNSTHIWCRVRESNSRP